MARRRTQRDTVAPTGPTNPAGATDADDPVPDAPEARPETRQVAREGEHEVERPRVRRRVSEEQVSVEVDLALERLRISPRVDEVRPARPDELERAFRPQTLRVPAFGEQPALRKKLVVTGEVVVHRRAADQPPATVTDAVARAAEPAAVTDAVRPEPIDLEEDEASPPEAAGVERAAPRPDERETVAMERFQMEAAGVEVAGVQAVPGGPVAVGPGAPPPDEAMTEVMPAPVTRGTLAPVDGITRVLREVRAGWTRARRRED